MTVAPTPTSQGEEPALTSAPATKQLRPVDWLKMVGLGTVLFIAFALVLSLFRMPNTVTSPVSLFLATWIAGRVLGWHGTAGWVVAAILIFVVTAIVGVVLLLLFASATL